MLKKITKKLLISSILISSITISQSIQAFRARIVICPSNQVCASDIAASVVFVAGAVSICAGITCINAYFTFQRSKAQYRLLKEFHENPYYSYDNFVLDARELYYEQSWTTSSTSLEFDHPVVWLEKAATANKNFLGCFVWKLFNEELSILGKKMGEKLNFLRKHAAFQADRKEYNEKYREQNYRDTRISIEQQKLNIAREKLLLKRN